MKKYKAKEQWAIISDMDAEVIGKEFERLFPNGNIETKKVVEHASSEKSVLHKYFEWDNEKAGHSWRLQQARHIIKAIVVVVEDREITAYQNVKLDETSTNSYVDIFKCMETTSLWDQVLQQAMAEITRWSERYKSYGELKEIHDAVEKTKEVLNGNKDKERDARAGDNNSATRV